MVHMVQIWLPVKTISFSQNPTYFIIMDSSMFLVPCLSYLEIVPYVNSVRIISVLDSSSIFLRLIIILCNLTSICHLFLPSWVHRWTQCFVFSPGPTSIFKSVDFNFWLWFFEHSYEHCLIQVWCVSIIDKDHMSPSLANTARLSTILVEFKTLLPTKQLLFLALHHSSWTTHAKPHE